MTDPIADMLTRIRNGQMAEKHTVSMPASKLKTAVARILQEEGFIAGHEEHDEGNGKRTLTVELKYFKGEPVITYLQRASRPGLRRYAGADEIPKVLRGLGVVILTTSKGVMTDRQARAENIGGELLCTVY
ncbi:small subunit ribosomal protein S8 [Thiohalorhabdus denitrificans]|uniref:Small ribosomal subunit protein uS8 n=2 Tax=Thiohalorhabdus denitrificans TaxID=381306 RepID=A0A1G5FV23_9GAMM|nr:small subunit ribosomal protein S8 [Thiohalorhabdus denitrificans]